MDEKPAKGNYDLTQSSSKRQDEKATRIAREQESDDANENTNLGQVSSEKGDSAAENKVATSLDNE
ncbi:MAG: hypothetical protein JWR72_2401 [Flavisolibacter sp.]|nr:hypothetical protein [Flavisolibacter sp.]